jgi:hypothetical protein
MTLSANQQIVLSTYYVFSPILLVFTTACRGESATELNREKAHTLQILLFVVSTVNFMIVRT